MELDCLVMVFILEMSKKIGSRYLTIKKNVYNAGSNRVTQAISQSLH